MCKPVTIPLHVGHVARLHYAKRRTPRVGSVLAGSKNPRRRRVPEREKRLRSLRSLLPCFLVPRLGGFVTGVWMLDRTCRVRYPIGTSAAGAPGVPSS